MKITHDDLARAYKSHIRKHVPSSRESCPSAESIFSVFDESASEADKEKVIEHVTTCSYCLQEFERFLRFHRDEAMAIGDIAGYIKTKDQRTRILKKRTTISEILLGPRGQTRPLWRWATTSLFAVIIIGFTLIGIKTFLRTPEDKERGRLPGQVHLISPVRGQMLKMPLVFQWERMATAEYYQLEIFDASLLPIWKSSQIEEIYYEFTPKDADIFKKSEVYFWAITASLIDGTKRESPLEEFILRE